VNCTLSHNHVVGGRGGELIGFGPTGESHGGGFANQAGSLSLLNSLVAGNTATTNSTPSDGFGTILSQGHNLLGTTNEFVGVTESDLTYVSPNLGPLQSNGGFAPTHALLLHSPALDAGTSAGAPAADQRDVPRPQGGGVDIGAFELPRVSILFNGHHLVSGPVTNLASAELTFQTTFTNGSVLYTLDGSAPSFESMLYTGPFTVTNSVLIRVIAYSADFSESSQAGPIQIVIIPLYSLAITTFGEGLVVADPSSGPYPSNSIVTLTAIPATNWDFLRWTGDVTGTSPSIQVTMDRVKSVQAEFSAAQVYTLTVEVLGNGSVSLNPLGGSYLSNTVVTLAASSMPGWAFDGWNGDVADTNMTVNTTMNRNKQVTARYVPVYSLSLSTAGGGTFTVDPSTGPYPSNSIVTVTAIPANGWSFLHWLGDASGTNLTATVSLTSDKCIRGLFGTTLDATVAGSGTVQISPPVRLHSYGQAVRLTAIPSAGSYFALWGNAASGTNNPSSFTVTNANPVVAALFASLAAGQFALTVMPDGQGGVSVSPQHNRYDSGQSVTLTAVPEVGQVFLGWSGDAAGTANPLTLTMDSNKTITAQYSKSPQLTIPDCFGYLGDAGFRLLLDGEIGSRYSIVKSSDLQQWSSVASVTNVLGLIQFDVPASTNANQEFYRALVLP